MSIQCPSLVIADCQSGSPSRWQKNGGIVTGGGKAQIFKAVAGQTISCYCGYATYCYATVDGNGVLYTRFNTGPWIPGPTASGFDATYGGYISISVGIGGLTATNTSTFGQPSSCGATWS